MKPGLYVATVRGVEGVMVIGPSSEDRAYRTSEPINGLYYHEAPQVTDARPLVVLDPKDSRAFAVDVAQAVGSALNVMAGRDISAGIKAVQDQIARLAAPTPAEPMGLGAVVRDRAGVLWVRARLAKEQWRRAAEWDAVLIYAPWSEIDSPEVLSEGWSE